MNTPNKDQKVKHAIKDINNSDSIDDILAYIALDDRPDVVDAAKLRIAEIDINHPFIQAPLSGAPGPASPPPADGAASLEGAKTMKQGQVEKITQSGTAPAPLPEFKMTTKDAAKSSVITIRDGKAVTVEFDEQGKEIA